MGRQCCIRPSRWAWCATARRQRRRLPPPKQRRSMSTTSRSGVRWGTASQRRCCSPQTTRRTCKWRRDEARRAVRTICCVATTRSCSASSPVASTSCMCRTRRTRPTSSPSGCRRPSSAPVWRTSQEQRAGPRERLNGRSASAARGRCERWAEGPVGKGRVMVTPGATFDQGGYLELARPITGTEIESHPATPTVPYEVRAMFLHAGPTFVGRVPLS
eukprot:7379777-Prymnesium_polylepis.1